MLLLLLLFANPDTVEVNLVPVAEAESLSVTVLGDG